MEHASNLSSPAATEGGPDPATLTLSPPAVRVSDRLADSLIEPALDAGRDVRPGRAQRTDGWTPERIRAFLTTLAECGVVADAARAAGMSRQNAYNLRNRAHGAAFALAWNAAEQLARRRVADDALSRAIHGCVELIVRDGAVVAERHRFDNRHTMAVLARLDRLAESKSEESRAARLVAQEFDQFLDIVCADGEGAADFLAGRDAAEPMFGSVRSAKVMRRIENYRRYGVGLPEEIDVSDLDPGQMASWTPEQLERAERSGLLRELAEAEAEDEGEEAPEIPARPRGVPPEAWAALLADGLAGQLAAPAPDPDPSPPEPAAPEPAPDDGRPPPGWVATDR